MMNSEKPSFIVQWYQPKLHGGRGDTNMTNVARCSFAQRQIHGATERATAASGA